MQSHAQPQSLEHKLGQMLMVGFHGLTLPEHIRNWLHKGRIGGVILFARNVESSQQLAALTRQVHEAALFPVLIGIDQEGGLVARMREAEGFSESPGPMALAASTDALTDTERASRLLAEEMRAVGINWTFAPAVDLSYNADNPTVGTRSFGSDPTRVSALAAAAVRGFQAGGVAACAKHFPGLGNTNVDTHLALPRLRTPVQQLLQSDLAPYRSAIGDGLASVMSTHTIFTALDDQHPATLSPVILAKLLRDELGYDGVVTSDCLEMKAIADHYGPGESTVLAALAGVDIVLISHTQERQEAAYAALLEAAQSGRITENLINAANRRIQVMKARFSINPSQDIQPDAVFSEEHRQISDAVARNGTVLVRSDGRGFPVQADTAGAALVEFASSIDSEVVESDGAAALTRVLQDVLPQLQHVSLLPWAIDETSLVKAKELAHSAQVLILVTRNAHMQPGQRGAARSLAAQARSAVIHVALRNPYDAALLREPGTVLCTNGDSAPSLRAAVDALLGRFTPTGTLPVHVETL